MEPLVALIMVIFGIGAGFFFGRLSNTAVRNSKRLDADLKRARSEHDSYRKDVTQHFEKTSELVNAMTTSYRAVYEHLATGAQNLCDEQAGKLIMEAPVERIASEDNVKAETVAPDEISRQEAGSTQSAGEQKLKESTSDTQSDQALRHDENEEKVAAQEGDDETGTQQDRSVAAAPVTEPGAASEPRTYH